MILAKAQRTPRKTFAVLAVFACMDAGEGREQDAEAWREKNDLFHG